MADSVDRVFVHALATVRRLPRTGSSRPPPASRLRLYGLYKQSMEGDVESIIARPTLPVSSPDPNSITGSTSVHRYASRDLRTREAQAEIEKWDAWHACAGLSRTEAKRQYISTLIDTMKEYASGTSESRELVSELEFVWNQIKNQTGSDPDNHSSPRSHGSGGGSGSGNQESPNRQLERAGLGRSQSQINSMSFSSNRPSMGSDIENLSRIGNRSQQQPQLLHRNQARLKRTESGLRVLSPVSQRDSDSIIEPVDARNNDEEDPIYEDNDNDDDDDENAALNTAPTSPLANRPTNNNASSRPSRALFSTGQTPSQGPHHNHNTHSHSPADWQSLVESHLRALKTEIAALREQLSANHLLSSSTFSHTYYTLTPRQRIIHRIKLYFRTFGLIFLKQLGVQLGFLALVLLWGRLSGDLRVEDRVRRVAERAWKGLRRGLGGILLWIWQLVGREGRIRRVGRFLRIV